MKDKKIVFDSQEELEKYMRQHSESGVRAGGRMFFNAIDKTLGVGDRGLSKLSNHVEKHKVESANLMTATKGTIMVASGVLGATRTLVAYIGRSLFGKEEKGDE